MPNGEKQGKEKPAPNTRERLGAQDGGQGEQDCCGDPGEQDVYGVDDGYEGDDPGQRKRAIRKNRDTAAKKSQGKQLGQLNLPRAGAPDRR